MLCTCLSVLPQIEQLQNQMVSLESEIVRLRENNQALQEANGALAGERGDLQARVQLLQERKEAEEAQAREERDRLLAQMQSFERQAKEAMKAAAQARRRLLKLRQELGVLQAERDFHRSAAKRRAKAATLANNKIRSKAPWVDASSRTRMRSTLNRMDSPAKDDWEDMSADRYFPPPFTIPVSFSLSISHTLIIFLTVGTARICKNTSKRVIESQLLSSWYSKEKKRARGGQKEEKKSDPLNYPGMSC